MPVTTPEILLVLIRPMSSRALYLWVAVVAVAVVAVMAVVAVIGLVIISGTCNSRANSTTSASA